MGMMFLFLDKAQNLDGLSWRTGAHALNDDGPKGWCSILRSLGARQITEEEYNELRAAAPATLADPDPLEPRDAAVKTEATNGSDNPGGTERDQISAADSIRHNRPGRRNRRVA